MPIKAEILLSCEKFLSAIKTVDGAITGLEHKVIAFAGAFAGLKVAGELVASQFEQLHQALELGGTLVDLSANTGQSIQDLVLLRQAFQNAGLGADGVGAAMAQLSKALTGVNEEGQPTKAAFDKLGISLDALKSMSAVEQIAALQTAFSGLPNAADRSKAAMDLFGKSGSKMLAIIADGEALTQARAQVGDLGQTLAANARAFDTIGDAMGALKQKGEQFYTAFAGALTQTAEGPLKYLSELDLTTAGEAIGRFAAGVLTLISALARLWPVLAGVAAAMLATTLSARLGWMAMSEGVAIAVRATVVGISQMRLQLASGSASFAMFAASARIGMGAAAFAVGKGVLSMLAALGPVGVAMMAVGYIIQRRFEKNAAASAQADSLRSVSDDRQTHFNGDVALIKSVATQEEKQHGLEQLDTELDQVHEKLRNVDKDYEHLNSEGRAQVVQEFQRWAQSIEHSREILTRVPDAIMQSRLAARELSKNFEDNQKRIEEMDKALDKFYADKRRAGWDDSDPVKKKENILDEAGMKDVRMLDDAIEAARIAVGKIDFTLPGAKESAERLKTNFDQLLDARREILQTEKAITDQQRQQAEKAEETRKKLAEHVIAQTAELHQMQAKAAGDGAGAVRWDDAKRRDELLKQNLDAGQPLMVATEKANEQVALERLQKLKEMQAQVDRDLLKMMALARGDTAGAKRIEDEGKREELIKKQIEAGEDPETAKRKADLQLKLEKDAEEKKSASVTADSDRRLGLGGVAVANSSDPMLREGQRQTRELQTQNTYLKEVRDLLKRPAAPIGPARAVFGRGF